MKILPHHDFMKRILYDYRADLQNNYANFGKISVLAMREREREGFPVIIIHGGTEIDFPTCQNKSRHNCYR